MPINRTIKRIIAGVCAFLCFFSSMGITFTSSAYSTSSSLAQESPYGEKFIMVSMGDSFSSGEGNENFYGQTLPIEKKVNCQDWLAHRSEKSWSGQLTSMYVTDSEDPMRLFKTNEFDSNKTSGKYSYETYDGIKDDTVEWYFVASSGATTKDFSEKQTKEVIRDGVKYTEKDGNEKKIYPQLDIFSNIGSDCDEVDYVTLTIGGNDLGFADVIAYALVASAGDTALDYLSELDNPEISTIAGSLYFLGGCNSLLYWDIQSRWVNYYNDIKERLKQTYKDIHSCAKNATIIVAGYPRLFDGANQHFYLRSNEINIINSACSQFNFELQKLIYEFNEEEGRKANRKNKDKRICYFASVENGFANHGAYSDDPYINPVILFPQDESLKIDKEIAGRKCGLKSDYSIHPDAKGIEVYRASVQRVINALESSVRGCILNKNTNEPIENISVSLSGGGTTVTVQTDVNGCFCFDRRQNIPTGKCKLIVSDEAYKEIDEIIVKVPSDGDSVTVNDILLEPSNPLVGTWSSNKLYWESPSLMTLYPDGTCILNGVPNYKWNVEGDHITFVNTLVDRLEIENKDNNKIEYSFEIDKNTLTMHGITCSDKECVYERASSALANTNESAGETYGKIFDSIFGGLQKSE